jgi:hypothetical protein
MITRIGRISGRWYAAIAAVFILICFAAPDAFGGNNAVSEGVYAEIEGDINAVGIFLGATTKFKDRVADETSFTLSFEYERLLAKWGHKWGFAGVVEFIFAEEFEGLIVPLVVNHPTEAWLLRTGVGLEIGREEDEERAAHLLWRLGTAYVFPVGNGFSLVPSFDFDAVRSDPAVAYGVVISKEF